MTRALKRSHLEMLRIRNVLLAIALLRDTARRYDLTDDEERYLKHIITELRKQ